VPTADPRILPKGTAFISDAGMTGAYESVLGFEISASHHLFLTQLPTRLPVADKCDTVVLNSVLVDIDEAGRATAIERCDRVHRLEEQGTRNKGQGS
jgi:calcineurin-like phosphoesterase